MRKQNRLRALRNLSIAALLFLFVWYLRGCPLPTAEMELHRSERQHLLSESRVIWTYDGTFRSDRDMMVAVAKDHVSTYLEQGRCWFWERTPGTPTVLVLPSNTRHNPDGKASSLLDPAFVAVDVPARAQSVRLYVLVSFNEWEEIYAVEGQKQQGLWFFQMERKYHHTDEYTSDEEWSRHHNESNAFSWMQHAGQSDGYHAPYTLELFDRDGKCFDRIDTNGGVVTVSDMVIVD